MLDINFDNSSCHNAMAEDALYARNMNVNPGGKQKILRDTSYNGKFQTMYFLKDGKKIAKGLKTVLEERGLSTHGKNLPWMRERISQHVDFKFEKCEIEKSLLKRSHIPTFLPKFHPELNPIERVWSQPKRYTHMIQFRKTTFLTIFKRLHIILQGMTPGIVWTTNLRDTKLQ